MDVSGLIGINAQIGLYFSGAMGVLCLLFSFIYFTTKERIYLFYTAFLLFSFLEGLVSIQDVIGFNRFIFKTPSTGPGAYYLELFTIIAYSFYCLFTIQLLDIKNQSKNLYWWIIFMAVSGFLFAIIFFFIPDMSDSTWTAAFFISRFIILVQSIIAIVWVFKKDIKSSVIDLFLLGSFLYFLGALIAVFRGYMNGKYPSLDILYPETYFKLGILSEVIVFTIAIYKRVFVKIRDEQQIEQKLKEQAFFDKDFAQTEALALKIQIDPHFLFNHLNLAKLYIQKKENEKAISYLVNLAKFIRNIEEMSQLRVISLDKEMNLVEHYLKLERTRLSNTFSYNIEIEANVSLPKVFIPPMILLSFVEEVIWSGIAFNEEAHRNITIQIAKDSLQNISITIAESVDSKLKISFLQAESLNSKRNKEITSERISLYNKHNDKKINYRVFNIHELEESNLLSKTVINISA